MKILRNILKDYRNIKDQFDAVGREYFDIYFKKCEELLSPSGILLCQIKDILHIVRIVILFKDFKYLAKNFNTKIEEIKALGFDDYLLESRKCTFIFVKQFL